VLSVIQSIYSYIPQPPAHAGSSLADFSTLKMEAIRSFEKSVHTRSTQRHTQKTTFFIVTAVKTSNLTWYLEVFVLNFGKYGWSCPKFSCFSLVSPEPSYKSLPTHHSLISYQLIRRYIILLLEAEFVSNQRLGTANTYKAYVIKLYILLAEN
jgi:hypothetical protein